MKQDHLGNNLFLRTVDKFNRVSMPAEIAEYLHAKQEMISSADKLSDRDDLCVFLAPNNIGFLINHFSSHSSLTVKAGWAEKRIKIGSPTKEIRADNYVCSRCDDVEIKKQSLKLPMSLLRFYGMSDDASHQREVVVRRFEHGHPLELGFVQIMDKDIWNKRFPKYTM